MRRIVIAMAIALGALVGTARAQPTVLRYLPPMSEQELGAQVGIATGYRVTPGGLRVAGRYLYRLAEVDWFEAHAAFTFGGGGAACFRDRDDVFVCDHAALDGFSGEVGGGVRRLFAARGEFVPYVRAGIAARVARFPADDVTGLAFPLAAAGGIRVRVAPTVAVGAEAAIEVGFGLFSRGLGAEPQLGLAVGGLVEFGL
jgi:hypothetical protein